MKMGKIFAATLLIACIHAAGHAEQPRFLGYWANAGMVSENHDHTNMTHVGSLINDRELATSVILQQLAEAKAHGIKAFVTMSPFVFEMSDSNSTPTGREECPFSILPGADVIFGDFVDELIAHGYLVPNDPGASTVAAFLPVDEPEDCGLKDETNPWGPHPALENAVNTIRNHPDTNNFPLYLNVTRSYGSVVQGMRLFDWVSMVAYGQDTDEYLSRFNLFTAVLESWQRTVLLPQASYGGFMEPYGGWHDPELIFDRFMSDPKVIGIIVFLWDHPLTTGTRDIPELRHAYAYMGRLIKAGVIFTDRFKRIR